MPMSNNQSMGYINLFCALIFSSETYVKKILANNRKCIVICKRKNVYILKIYIIGVKAIDRLRNSFDRLYEIRDR